MVEREDETDLPTEPIHRLTGPLARFLHIESASGIVLLVCTAVALLVANSPWSEGYLRFWEQDVGFRFGSFSISHSLHHWINDGMMVLFFFVIGLEVKRELVLGELREMRKAALPIAAAIGGMVVPAALYYGLLAGEPGARGWGIPMATDIAFVVGCMAVLGSRIPHQLRVTLLSLAIADDIGAILVIAIGYTDSLDMVSLAIGLALIGLIGLFARLGVRSFVGYTVVGLLVWFFFEKSGVHATIAGVILGLMTPARAYLSETTFGALLGRAQGLFQRGEFSTLDHRVDELRRFQRKTREIVSPLEFLEKSLHPYTSFLVMPVFALANAGVPIRASALTDSVALAVAAGLLIGKPLGIVGASWLAVRTGIARLPGGFGWGALLGGGFLCGIGFTMALFIAGLALEGDDLSTAKVGILFSSAIAAVIGVVLLLKMLPPREPSEA